jgi:adrenodoxin-NADP+ reductase
MNIPTVAFEPFPRDLYPGNLKSLPRIPARIGEVLVKGTPPGRPGILKTWALDFLKAPISIDAENDRVSSVTFIEQEIPFKQRWYPFAKPYPTDIEDTMEASVVFRSIGYKATPLSGLFRDLGVKFDNKVGIIPNDVHGRVISPERGPGNLTAGHVPGMYCAGWVKRGPTGVIASTMEDAFASADIIAQDWEANVPFMNTEGGESMSTHLGWDGVKDEVIAKGVQPLSWKDWKVIDAAERDRGKKLRKEREKFGTVKEMLQVLNE